MNLPRIPSMNELLEEGAGRGLDHRGRTALHHAIRDELDALRKDCSDGISRELDNSFWEQVEGRLALLPAMSLVGAQNGTGVVLHTNLGRAPWASEAITAANQVAQYGTVEISRETGGRGRRDKTIAQLLAQLSGTEDGLAVNNNAAAVLLMLSSLAQERKVVVARRELVEIGGSYRMPEVISAAGATMLEIGTTNRVHLSDYESALEDPDVACLFKAHPSNFEISGFEGEPSLEELASLCHERGVPFVYDLGSGVFNGAHLPGLSGEPTVPSALEAGCDLVSFSGDKLLGGPQAGLIVGATPLVEKLRRNMMTRCLRLDKTILAALEATLRLHALGEEVACSHIPGLSMLGRAVEQLQKTADLMASQIVQSCPGISVDVASCDGRVGSGASPNEPLPSIGLLLQVEGFSAEDFALKLRNGTPPIFSRIQGEAVLLDVRTLSATPEELAFLLSSSLA